MVKVARGDVIKLTANYRDAYGVLTDPTNPLLDIEDPNDTVIEDDVVPSKQATGQYYYNFTVPILGALGVWEAIWMGEIPAGYPIDPVSFHFEVVDVGEVTVDLTTIQIVRSMIGKLGEHRVSVMMNELTNSVTTTKIYAAFPRMLDIVGVWLATDITHAGTNYYGASGTFDPFSGEIILDTALPSAEEAVLLTYSFEEGLSDVMVQQFLDAAETFIEGYSGITFTYGSVTTISQRMAEQAALALVVFWCVLAINGANATQLGYNFRLDEFEIQSKLWGEGMIAEALFNQYRQQFLDWLHILGRKTQFIVTARKPNYGLTTILRNARNRYGSTSTRDSERSSESGW